MKNAFKFLLGVVYIMVTCLEEKCMLLRSNNINN